MKTLHPQEHPAGRTFGLTEGEVAELRLAVRSPLWRYLILDRRLYMVAGTALLCGWSSSGFRRVAAIFVMVLLGCVVSRIYDWICNRRLARRLGY